MSITQGINHLGLAVRDLDATTSFFVDALGWTESGRDESYPRTAVSDGQVRLTLWQVDHSLGPADFHLDSEQQLNEVAAIVQSHPGVEIEFLPELVGDGPRKHMMCAEPGGIRIEFIWGG